MCKMLFRDEPTEEHHFLQSLQLYRAVQHLLIHCFRFMAHNFIVLVQSH